MNHNNPQNSTAIDWSVIYKNHRGLWVALDHDEKTVLASGMTAKEALEKATKKGFDQPILSKMPQNLNTYIG